MSAFTYANDSNIRRFKNLLETSVDEAERRIIESLLAAEKTTAELLNSEPAKK